jgi:type I restriction enzyme M protein
MAKKRRKRAARDGRNSSDGANLGFEATLWAAADKLRGHMDAAEYKHVVLGLIFLKYISDAFEEVHARLAGQEYADPEDRDEYMAENVFWVPKEARWSRLQDNAKQPTIGKLIDDAMVAIERDNQPLKGVLPKDYGRPTLDKTRLGELIDLIGTIGLGDKANRSKDILGRVYDPCCGFGGMFVQSERFVEAHGGRVGDLSIFGQESNPTTWRLAKMNLAIRGIEANLGPHHADTFHNDLHPDLKADFILFNPPFNDSDWGKPKFHRHRLPAAGTAFGISGVRAWAAPVARAATKPMRREDVHRVGALGPCRPRLRLGSCGQTPCR